MNFIFKGKCWKFGNNIGVDGDLMPLEFAIKREIRPEILAKHTMKGLDPKFASNVAEGDILIAGERFAQGNPHIQGLLGIAGLGLGLVVESIPRGSFRNAINAGVPILPNCPDVTKLVETGDELEVNFETGSFINHSRGQETQFEALAPALLKTISLGGWKPMVEHRIANMLNVPTKD